MWILTSIFVIIYLFNKVNFTDQKEQLPSSLKSPKIPAGHITLLENVIFNYSTTLFPIDIDSNLTCCSSHEKVVLIMNSTIIRSLNSVNDSIVISFVLSTRRLGRAFINCTCQNQYKSHFNILNINVERKITLTEMIFTISIFIFVILISFVIGCSIKMEIISKFLQLPISLVIGLFGQYILMPLLTLGLSKLFFINNEFSFGLFIISCSPGGGNSNLWILLLKGDLNLSLTINLLSSIIALFLMPIWIFCFCKFFLDLTLVGYIPYEYVILNILPSIISGLFGMFLRWKYEKLAMGLVKVTKILSMIFILFLLTFGIYIKLYMYAIILDYLYLIPVITLLSSLGFIIIFSIGMICKQGVIKSLTISIEVCVPNMGIAIILLTFYIPKPFGDIAVVMPFILLIIVLFPLTFGYIGKLIISNIYQKKFKNSENSNNFPISSYTIYQPVFLLNDYPNKIKESTVEPTLYYTEEPSEYLDNPEEEFL